MKNGEVFGKIVVVNQPFVTSTFTVIVQLNMLAN